MIGSIAIDACVSQ